MDRLLKPKGITPTLPRLLPGVQLRLEEGLMRPYSQAPPSSNFRQQFEAENIRQYSQNPPSGTHTMLPYYDPHGPPQRQHLPLHPPPLGYGADICDKNDRQRSQEKQTPRTTQTFEACCSAKEMCTDPMLCGREEERSTHVTRQLHDMTNKMDGRLDIRDSQFDDRFDGMMNKIGDRLDDMNSRFDDRFDDMMNKIGGRLDDIDARFDDMLTTTHSNVFDQSVEEIQDMSA